MYDILRHTHSGLRWIVLLLLIMSIFSAYRHWERRNVHKNKQPFLFNLIAIHVQTLVGLVLYFISPKVIHSAEMMKSTVLRFYGVEHIIMMIIAAIVITIGYSKAKRQTDPNSYKTLLIYNIVALVIILIAIPWPFREALGGAWF